MGLQILQIVFLLMYFFVDEVMQTYLKMVASLGESPAISCQEGSLVRSESEIETELKFSMCAGEGWRIIIFRKDVKDGIFFLYSFFLWDLTTVKKIIEPYPLL